MKKFSWKTVIIVLIIVGIAAFFFTKDKKTAEVATVVEEEFITPVQVTSVSKGTVKDFHKFGGTVTARDKVSVLPDTAGKIVEVSVRAGDYVEKDQVIGKIDASRAGQTYMLSSIKAPISGTVTKVNGVVGSMTSTASPFAEIQTLDDLEISFSVIERFVTMVNEGSKATVTFDAFEDEVFDAYISHVDPTLDTSTRTLSVKAKLDKEESRVKAGMFARLNVTTRVKENVLTVPYEAVSISPDGDYVFVVKDGLAVKTVVETGIKDGKFVEITSGLNMGDQLVTRGQGLLSDGQKVRIVN